MKRHSFMNKICWGVLACLALTALPISIAHAGELLVTGAVEKEKKFTCDELRTLGTVVERVKVGSEQKYSGAFEVTAVPLDLILTAVGVKKKTSDGFNRELDLCVQMIDRSGKKAIYSYGEIFLSTRKHQVLVTVGVRYLLPHKHPDIKGSGLSLEEWSPFGRTLLRKSDQANCAVCHNGPVQQKLAPPAGYCGFTPDDIWYGRLLEDVVEIQVRQVPVDTVKDLKTQNKDTMWVEKPTLILPDDTRLELTDELLGTHPRFSRHDCSFGLGKGFHGIQQRDGIDLAALLGAHLKGADWRNLCVLITCADGYRSLFSGGELFGNPLPGRYLLVDQENGKPIKERGGKFKLFPQPDFYVDRCLRSIAEIRCYLP